METDLISFPPVMEAKPDTFIQTEKTNRIGVRVFKLGLPYVINGLPSLLVIKPDKTTLEISQNGSIQGNSIVFTLPDAVYEQKGPIQLAIRISHNGDKTTLGVIKGIMYPTRI